jgi:hypothetical protein
MFFDQPRLPIAVPVLQLLLPSDRFLWRCECLHMDEAVHTIFLDEFRAAAAAMALKPNPEIVGNANVKRSVPAARENINIVPAAPIG